MIKAIGEEARLMLGRTPGNIAAVRPLRQGVISDYIVTEKMIKYFVQKALGKRTFKKPNISICVPRPGFLAVAHQVGHGHDRQNRAPRRRP